jgi:hypothetical protein
MDTTYINKIHHLLHNIKYEPISDWDDPVLTSNLDAWVVSS